MKASAILVVFLLLGSFAGAVAEEQDATSSSGSGSNTSGSGTSGSGTSGSGSTTSGSSGSDGSDTKTQEDKPPETATHSTSPEGDDARAYCKEHPEERKCQELAKQYCEDHPEDSRCDAYNGDATAKQEMAAHCREHPEERKCQELAERYCKDHPNDSRCEKVDEFIEEREQAMDVVACLRGAKGDEALDARGRAKSMHAEVKACCDRYDGDVDELERLCERAEEVRDALARYSHVSFQPMESGLGFEAYTVSGHVVMERFEYTPVGPVPEVEANRKGSTLAIEIGDEALVRMQDNPTGLLKAKGAGTFDVRFAEGTNVSKSGEGWLVRGDGWQGRLLAHEVNLDGEAVSVTGFISFHVKPQVDRLPAAIQEKATKALEDRRLGAEISLAKRAAQATDDDENVEVLAYDDLDVKVDMPAAADLPDGRATVDDPIRVEVSAELEEGRTIVVDIDPALIPHETLDELDLRYYDVVYDNETRHEVEVTFQLASSLDDVMDPTDDGIQPEYWIIEDIDGVHLLVSIPTWSTHAITLASIAEFVTQPSVVMGATAGLAGSVIASVALLRPRRDDEFED